MSFSQRFDASKSLKSYRAAQQFDHIDFSRLVLRTGRFLHRPMFNRDSPAHSVLQLLRDEAHGLANRVHRDYREMLPFYEAKGFERPLVVPLRFHAANGNADDLIPIRSI